MEKKAGYHILAIVVCILACVYSYSGDEMFSVGGFDFYFYLPIAVIIVLAALCAFLIAPNFARMEIVVKQLGIVLLPVIFPFVWSLMLWIIRGAGLVEIRKGIMTTAYLASGICMMAALVYITGENAVWWYLASLIIANSITAIIVVMSGGPGNFLGEFWTLLVTFAGETGELMKKMELHAITYALGCYLVYFGIENKNISKRWPLFMLSILCFLLGLKRIAVAAVLAAIVVGLIWNGLKHFPHVSRFLLRVAGILFLVSALAYVGAVFYGLYDYLEQIGINTSARADIYRMYRPYYKFSPSFLGNGLGWVEAQMNVWSSQTTDLVYHTHNDYLREYIELGMAGFLIWCCLRCHVQISSAKKRMGVAGEAVAFGLIVYMAITYTTDMTAMQSFINNSFAVILLSFQLRKRETERNSMMERENRRLSDPPGEHYG